MAKPLKSSIQAKYRIIFIHIVLNTSIWPFLRFSKWLQGNKMLLKKLLLDCLTFFQLKCLKIIHTHRLVADYNYLDLQPKIIY